ncbi:MAG: tetratricopeptide repeat protein [Hespellia sp.]|nr:tetratricopeptide repeat protein [Hespellia sp.]
MKKAVGVALAMTLALTGCTNYVEDGTSQLETGSYTEAIATFEKAVEKEQGVAEAYRGIGLANYELEKYEEAKSALDSAIENGGEATPTLYNIMGICDMKMENYASALNNFNMGISLAEGTQENESEDSKADYTEVKQEMEFNMVVCYEKQFDWANAKAKMVDYISKYPDDAAAQKEAQFLETR